jgi:hypothetical protein
MLVYNKEYSGWERDFRATKTFACVCTAHNCTLDENETYLFRRHVEGGVQFDEDEVDLSGMDCPRAGVADLEHCDDFWEAREVIV